jgi:hypothetical protein
LTNPTFTGREFNRDASGAKRAADKGAAFITDRLCGHRGGHRQTVDERLVAAQRARRLSGLNCRRRLQGDKLIPNDASTTDVAL